MTDLWPWVRAVLVVGAVYAFCFVLATHPLFILPLIVVAMTVVFVVATKYWIDMMNQKPYD